MDETNHSSSGPPRIIKRGPNTTIRLVLLVLTALLGAMLVISVARTTWLRIGHLQQEFADLRADSFYLGVRLHSGVRQLNDTLLRYRLTGNTDDYNSFVKDSGELAVWLVHSGTNMTSQLERKFYEQVEVAYEDYVVECRKVLESDRASWLSSKARNFQNSYEKVQARSKDILDLCETFISNQRVSFDNFLRESNNTLSNFLWLLKVALVLLLTLAGALVVLVYRGMIAPLKHQLTESQAIIARQEKLASLGVLAAGVAHEIRNPLTAIKFRLFSLRKSLPDGAENEDAVVINNEITRLERIVKDVLQFARPSEPELVSMPVDRLLREVYDLLKPQLDKSGITVKLDASQPAWVRADTPQIKQVLINLIQNAADSMADGGVITLRSSRPPDADRHKPGTVALEVSDNGPGIPPDVQKRLFDPFFTTKEGGTGLGLPIAARIVEKHGGELRYETEKGRGTTFFIILPQTSEHETQNPVG